MKKFIFAIAAVAISASAIAQDYNRVGISYNNDHYGFNKDKFLHTQRGHFITKWPRFL